MGRYAKLRRNFFSLSNLLNMAANHEWCEVSMRTYPSDPYHDTFPLDYNVVHKDLPDSNEKIVGYDTRTNPGTVNRERLEKMERTADEFVMNYYENSRPGFKTKPPDYVKRYFRGLDPKELGATADSPYQRRERSHKSRNATFRDLCFSR